MHCYRVTTFNPAHPVYILRGKQKDAFDLARANTNDRHSPVVALIDLPTHKEAVVDLANDPTNTIGSVPSLMAWEFYMRGAMACGREIPAGYPSFSEPAFQGKVAATTIVEEASATPQSMWGAVFAADKSKRK